MLQLSILEHPKNFPVKEKSPIKPLASARGRRFFGKFFLISELKKIYEKFGLIKRGFKRKSERGNKYTLCYEESTNVFVKIGYFLDETPPKIFQAMRIFRNLEKAVPKRYGISI